MRVFSWLLRGFLFFTLFAFALNNQQLVSVRWFFGLQSQAPMVMVVLVAFACGGAAGVISMVPSWWRHRQQALKQSPEPGSTPALPFQAVSETPVLVHPPREGL
jgi:lipopolysaccharide assembly protein A